MLRRINGDKIKQIRSEQGLSKETVCIDANISYNTLSNAEDGVGISTTARVIKALADHYGVKEDDISYSFEAPKVYYKRNQPTPPKKKRKTCENILCADYQNEEAVDKVLPPNLQPC